MIGMIEPPFKKVFVSQPMGGLTTEQIATRRNQVAEIVKSVYGDHIEVIDSTIRHPEQMTINWPVYCLGASIELMSSADLVVFDVGWEQARGCKIEHHIATSYDIAIAYVDDLIANNRTSET